MRGIRGSFHDILDAAVIVDLSYRSVEFCGNHTSAQSRHDKEIVPEIVIGEGTTEVVLGGKSGFKRKNTGFYVVCTGNTLEHGSSLILKYHEVGIVIRVIFQNLEIIFRTNLHPDFVGGDKGCFVALMKDANRTDCTYFIEPFEVIATFHKYLLCRFFVFLVRDHIQKISACIIGNMPIVVNKFRVGRENSFDYRM